MISNAEKILAEEFDRNRMRYRQQCKIGCYRVDFLLPPNVILEVEGPFHDSTERLQADRERQQYLQRRGYEVLRLTDQAVRNDARSIVDLVIQHGGCTMHYRQPKRYKPKPRGPPKSKRTYAERMIGKVPEASYLMNKFPNVTKSQIVRLRNDLLCRIPGNERKYYKPLGQMMEYALRLKQEGPKTTKRELLKRVIADSKITDSNP